jgi:hypothetical protein
VKEPVKIGTMQSKRYGKVAIWKGQYMSNGAMSISLVDQEGPLATLSVNMDHGQMQGSSFERAAGELFLREDLARERGDRCGGSGLGLVQGTPGPASLALRFRRGAGVGTAR